MRPFGLFIFGDEILSGKREDAHFDRVKSILGARGLALSWVHYLGDDRLRCTQALRQSFASDDVVLSCGGIGSTPDDHTRQAAADALGLPLVLHPKAAELIRERAADTGQVATVERLRMGEFPQGADIIPNPYNKIAGFSIRSHHFVPGFPVMAWPMMEWVLDTYYRDLFRSAAEFDQSMIVLDCYEATITPLMQTLCERYPQFKFYSLPSAGENGRPRHVELGVKAQADDSASGSAAGQAAQAPALFDQAYAEFKQGVIALGGRIAEEITARR